MALLGSLVVSLAANTAAFDKDLGRSAYLAAKRMDHIKATATNAAVAIVSGLHAAAGAVATLTKQAIDNADHMVKMAQSVGTSVEELSGLAYGAGLSGVAVESLGTALGRFNRNIVDAQGGTGDAVRAFDALGIKLTDNSGKLKSQQALLAEVADKLSVMKDGAEKSAIAQLLLGKSGAELIPLLNQGAAGIREMSDEARVFGQVIDKETAQAAENFNDNLTRLNAVKKGFANQIMVAVLPALNDFTDGLISSAKEADLMKDAVTQAATGVKLLISSGVIVAATFEVVGKSLGAVAAAAVAIFEGDWKRAMEIGSEAVSDWGNTVAAAKERVTRLFDDQARAAEEAQRRIDKAAKRPQQTQAAPKVLSTEEIKAREKILEDARQAEIKGWVKLAEQIQDQDFKAAEEAARVAQDRIAFLEDSMRTEEEVLQDSYDTRLFDLEDALDRGMITQEKYQKLLEQATAEHEAKLSELVWEGLSEREKFQQMSMKDQAKTIFGELENITSGVAQHNKALFQINKIAGIANAVISAYEGISKTLAAYPYPWNLAMAALHGVVAFQQVAAIAGTTYGATTAAPSLAGSTAAPPVQPVNGPSAGPAPQQTRIVHLHGDVFDRSTVRRLLEDFNENSRDGGRVVVV